jgi:rubrerythrin
MLWAQVTHWVGQAKNTNAERLMRSFSIIFGVGALVFLGYHFVRLFGSKPDRRTQVDEAKRHFLLPESEEEARARYRAAWQKYRRLRVLFPLAFLGWLPYAGVLGALFSFFHLTGKVWGAVWGALVMAWIPSVGIFGWQWAFWQCPRCGYAFKGLDDPFFPKRCRRCELPMWAESPNE